MSKYEEFSDMRIILADSPEDPRANDRDYSNCSECKHCHIDGMDKVAFCYINKWFMYDEEIFKDCYDNEACSDYEEGYPSY